MKFGVKTLGVALGAVVLMGAVAATPASAGGKKCKIEKEITKIFSGDWLRR
jgi:hypothetical protein